MNHLYIYIRAKGQILFYNMQVLRSDKVTFVIYGSSNVENAR